MPGTASVMRSIRIECSSAVAEVVEVFERSATDILRDIDQPSLGGIERSVTEVRIRYAPADIACPDLIEMAVRPAHGSLQHEVQAIQADRQWNLEPAHDGRFKIVELDPQMSNRGGSHAARLRPSDGRGQCHGSSPWRREGARRIKAGLQPPIQP